MICQDCQSAGHANSMEMYESARRLHAMCKTAGCVCQHGTGPNWIKRGTNARS